MALFKLFLSICFLRKDPTQVPASGLIFSKVLLIYASVSTLLKALIMNPMEGVIQTLYELGLMFAFILILLMLVGKRKQILQTMITFLACESIIGACALPVAVWLNLIDSGTLWIPFYSLFIFIAWGTIVVGFILKQTLAKNMTFSFRLACVYFLQTYVASSVLLII